MASALSKSLGVRCESLHFDFSGCADEVFRASSSNKLSVAIIGGNDEHLNRFVSLLHSRYPKLRIVFSHNGYFDFSGSSSIFTKLEQSKPDLILVSMGSPRQEKFCAEVKKRTLGHPKLITCGAFVSQTALAGDNYYPDIIVKLRIRWLYRLTKDHRIFPRILKYYFPFIIREYITGKNELFK